MKTTRLQLSTSRRPEDTPPPPADLYVEPKEDLLVLGEMLHDVATIGEMLRELPFSRLAYRGNLRVVRGAAVRMANRCAKLLDEVEPKPSTNIDSPAEASTIHSAGDSTGENWIADAPEEEARRVMESMAHSPNLVAPIPATRKNGSDRPKKTGKDGAREYSLAESFVLSMIKEHGGSVGTETLLRDVCAKHPSVVRAEVNDALSALRRDKIVLTANVGRGIQNRLAE